MTSATVLAPLRRFDDDTWAALASVGLLRRARKDLAGGEPPEVLSENDSEVVVAVGGQRVRFDADGPAQARCDCPSATVCRHIVAAGLWLAESSDDQDLTAVGDELLALGAADLTKHAGAPGHRWAWNFVDELDDDDILVTDGAAVQITLQRHHLTFRYAGGGLPGLIADQKVSPLPRYQVAAAIAYQRTRGTPMAALVAPKSATQQQESQAENRQRLRHSARQLLLDTVRLGVAHPSVGLHERYETAAVWAQGAEYHRLSLLLNRIADHVEQMLARSATVGTGRLVAEIALGHALLAALETAAAADHAPGRLVGQARNQYSPVRAMTVYGMGSVPWRAASGYHGLTTLFWWADQRRFLSLTDARPVDLYGFDPSDRYDEPGPWHGLASPGAAAGRRLDLEQARLNPAGRLSAVESTQAFVMTVGGEDFIATLQIVDRWSELRAGHVKTRALLDPPDPLDDWVVLAPHAFDTAEFDQTRQVLRWPVADAVGDELMLTVAYDDLSETAIARIEALGDRVPARTLVVARLRGAGHALTAEPLSLIRPDADVDPVDSLFFGDAGPPPAPQPVRRSAPAPVGRVPAPLAELRTLRAWLVRAAERGTAGGRDEQLRTELADRHRHLRDQGFVVFPADLDPSVPAAEHLLRTYCLAEQTERVLPRTT